MVRAWVILSNDGSPVGPMILAGSEAEAMLIAAGNMKGEDVGWSIQEVVGVPDGVYTGSFPLGSDVDAEQEPLAAWDEGVEGDNGGGV